VTDNGWQLLAMLCESEDPVPRGTLEEEFEADFSGIARWIHRELGTGIIEAITGDDGTVIAYSLNADRRLEVCAMLD